MAGPHYWTGGTSSDLGTAANWSTAAVPINSEVARFNGTPTNAPAGGTAFNAVTGLTILVGRDYTKGIGSSGAPVQINTTATVVVDAPISTGCYFDIEGGELNVLDAPMQPSKGVVVTAGTLNPLRVQRGYVSILSGVTLTLWETQHLGSPFTDCQIDLENGVVVTTARLDGGDINCAATLASASVYLKSGYLKHVNTATGTVTLVEVEDGAVFDADGTAQPTAATYTTTRVFGGVLNAVRRSYAKVFTAVEVWPGGYFKGNLASITGTLTLKGGKADWSSAMTVVSTGLGATS